MHPEEGISHQEPMPDAPDPGDAARFMGSVAGRAGRAALADRVPFEWRYGDPPDYVAKPGESTKQMMWMRTRAPLPDDRILHAAAIAFLSDDGSLAGVERRYGWDGFSHYASASLDHALWLHQPPRWDDWLLMVTDTPVAHAARALHADGSSIRATAYTSRRWRKRRWCAASGD